MAVCGLFRQRGRVIDRRWYTRLLAGRDYAVAPLGHDRVLGPSRDSTGNDFRRVNNNSEKIVIESGDLLPCLYLVLENPQLLQKDGRLYRVEPSVDTDPDIVIFVASLTVHAERAHDGREVVIIGQHGAAIAITTEWLRREKARRGRLTEPADPSSV